MSDAIVTVLLILFIAWTMGFWNPTITIQHGDAPPDTVTVRWLQK